MELNYGPEHDEYREQVRGFLRETWKEGADVVAFRQQAIEAGYLYRGIPKRFGGSEQPSDVIRARIIAEEFAAAKAPGEIKGNGVQMLVPTLLERGAEWQKERFVAKTLSGEYRWAQGFSEPGSGSDLASLRTRGELRDGQWVINGQKVWTSYAKDCQYMFALIRTEPEASKHQGISYLLIDLDQPGIDIRPMKQINGGNDFNEVFFTDAVTPEDWIVGERGNGWSVSKSLLKHERNMLGGIDRSESLFDSLLGLAKRTSKNGAPAIKDPWVRDRLAALKAELEVQRCSSFIQMTRELSGNGGGLLQMMNKLGQSNYAAAVADVANAVLEDEGLISPIGNRRPGNERWVNQYMNSLAAAIAGGTSNIQRNIIAERGLGLPRESSQE
ncbi:acyl-CoA dehydrogenase family protein [Pseudomonas sp. PDM24]|jgi:alkylation response protein AidB-like acyl-CoA dehydrogenase|uniref:acyl-CoA dehydrogenase family protein n=1 Tax=Pseudomonas sp. PDM24 TaxID=2854777 RepID=UPI001C454127|nr:acyl-CoA dehydrogenase family protein [Pseudomonas sp. PDM24]MBV7495095.1 acyl-CoA dehydrogenase family protein [Pseudomonas sp. PDM24]